MHAIIQIPPGGETVDLDAWRRLSAYGLALQQTILERNFVRPMVRIFAHVGVVAEFTSGSEAQLAYIGA